MDFWSMWILTDNVILSKLICTTIIEISSNCCNFTDFWARAVFFTPKVAFWKAWMKNKVIADQMEEEKIEKIELVSYRSNTGKGKGRIWERSYFEEIQVKFYQLSATVIRWSLENLKTKYQNYRSFDEVEEEKKKKRAVLQRNSQKSQKSWNFIVRDERPRNSERFELSQAILWVK